MRVHNRELMTVPMGTGVQATEVYSGVARMAGVLWCTRVRAGSPLAPTRGRRADTAVVVVHPSSNFLGHYALEAWAEQGVDAIAMTTRYLGNDSVLLLENCVLDIAAVVGQLRLEGYERVVLIGNSGGGGLVALYQEQVEHPSITSAPGGAGPDLTAAELPPVDALITLMAHPGRAQLLAETLDPAVLDEDDPDRRDPDLDMFDPANGPGYDPDWLSRYRAAQLRRNDLITERVEQRLAQVLAASDGRLTDEPFSVQATNADPRNLDLSIDPSDRELGTLWGPPEVANRQPTTLAHFSSLQSWLSQWSVRTSNGDGPKRLGGVSVPVHVIYGTADQACFPSHARQLYDGISHDQKAITPIRGGRHYLNGQPELTLEMAAVVGNWVREAL